MPEYPFKALINGEEVWMHGPTDVRHAWLPLTPPETLEEKIEYARARARRTRSKTARRGWQTAAEFYALALEDSR